MAGVAAGPCRPAQPRQAIERRACGPARSSACASIWPVSAAAAELVLRSLTWYAQSVKCSPGCLSMFSSWALEGPSPLWPTRVADRSYLPSPATAGGPQKSSIQGRSKAHPLSLPPATSSAEYALPSDPPTEPLQHLHCRASPVSSAAADAPPSLRLQEDLHSCIEQRDYEQAYQKLQLLINADIASVDKHAASAVVEGEQSTFHAAAGFPATVASSRAPEAPVLTA